MNGRYMRERAARALRGRARRPPRAQRPGRPPRRSRRPTPEARREACEIVRDKAQTVTEVWPLIAFLFTEPRIEDVDPKVWSKVMKPGTRSLLRKADEVIAAAEPFDAETLEARPPRADRLRGRLGDQGPAADPGRDHRLEHLAGHLRIARRARPRARRSPRLDRADRPTSATGCPGTIPTRVNGIAHICRSGWGDGCRAHEGCRPPLQGHPDADSREDRHEAPQRGAGKGRQAPRCRLRRRQPDAGPRGDGRPGRQGRLAGELVGHRDHRAGRDRHGDGDRGDALGQQRRRSPRPRSPTFPTPSRR